MVWELDPVIWVWLYLENHMTIEQILLAFGALCILISVGHIAATWRK